MAEIGLLFLWGLIHMTSAKFSDSLTPSAPCPNFQATSLIDRVQNRVVRVCEFAVVFLFTLPSPGRAEE